MDTRVGKSFVGSKIKGNEFAFLRERRRLRMGQIEVFKWYRGYNKGDINKILKVINQDITRNTGFKLERNVRLKEK